MDGRPIPSKEWTFGRFAAGEGISRPHGWKQALLAFVFVLTWPAAVSSSRESSSSRHVLTVSASIDHFPYSYRDESGRLSGYAVDLLDAVADVMKVRLKRIEVSPEQDIDNLREGRYDIGQFHAPNPGKENPGEFSQPVLVNYGEIFVRKGDSRIRTLDGLRKCALKVAGPNQAVEYLVENGFDLARVREGSSPECLKWLSEGKVDAVVLSRLTGLSQAYYLGIKNVEPVGADLSDLKVTYCIATRTGDTELAGRINEALATLSVTGKTVEIYSKWFGRYETRGLSVLQILLIVMGSLLLALIVALWALHRQRQLRHRIALQAEELRKSEDILAEAQKFSLLGHWQRDLMGEGPSLWSAETYRIFERDPALGPPSTEEMLALAVPADRERWRKVRDSANGNGDSYEIDLVIETRPGRQKYIHERGRPVLDGCGRCVAFFGTVQDVSAARAAEAALRRSEQLLSALYANLPIGLGAVEYNGEDWVFMSINPAAVRQHAFPRIPHVGCPLKESGLAPEQQEQWSGLFFRSAEAAAPLNVEIAHNDLHSVHTMTVVPLDPVDDRRRCLFLIEDVTDKKRKDAEIAQGRRLRAIGELVGGIAHEFNNLLTPISISSEMLLKEWSHVPELRAGLKTIADAAERSAKLTQRLLSFGRRSEKPERIDLGDVVDANVQLMRHTIDRRIDIQPSVPQDLPPLFLNSGDIHQILLNLLVNARDTLVGKLNTESRDGWQPRICIEAEFLSPNATVPLDPSRKPAGLSGWIRLTVRDNGLGMPPHVLERLFEPFYTTKEGHGTGLGLATIWHLVADFGGRIDVESVAGDGSAFHVCIPVVPAPAPEEASPVRIPTEGADKVRHFLLVEDEPAVARVVEAMLMRRNHRITRASDGSEAWHLLSSASNDFDCVIMDLNMPAMNGLELARRARDASYDRPLIIMSGRITEEEQAALKQLRIMDVIHKPFTVSRLEEAIARAFSRLKSD